jgi:hypothetical protein
VWIGVLSPRSISAGVLSEGFFSCLGIRCAVSARRYANSLKSLIGLLRRTSSGRGDTIIVGEIFENQVIKYQSMNIHKDFIETNI